LFGNVYYLVCMQNTGITKYSKSNGKKQLTETIKILKRQAKKQLSKHTYMIAGPHLCKSVRSFEILKYMPDLDNRPIGIVDEQFEHSNIPS
jgi:hypothetical protein